MKERQREREKKERKKEREKREIIKIQRVSTCDFISKRRPESGMQKAHYFDNIFT